MAGHTTARQFASTARPRRAPHRLPHPRHPRPPRRHRPVVLGHTGPGSVTYAEVVVRIWFLWCELTSRCQLSCQHCYAESGPAGAHGLMRPVDWARVLNQATELGVRMVQFIGGEPTLYPDLAHLVDHALRRGLA
ncbi:MAG: radical SAM protein, partial [Actinomycetes bacterium]